MTEINIADAGVLAAVILLIAVCIGNLTGSCKSGTCCCGKSGCSGCPGCQAVLQKKRS